MLPYIYIHLTVSLSALAEKTVKSDLIQKYQAWVMLPDKNTKPQVYYIG